MLIQDFFTTIYRPLRLRGKSPRTTILYELSIKSFSKTLGKPAELSDFTDYNVSRHMQRVRDEGRSAGTANKDRAQLTALWRLAYRRGLVNVWPDITEDIEPERVPEAWLPEETERLIQAAAKVAKPVGDIPGCFFWEAIIRTCLDTAERIGAIRECKWQHLSGHWLRLPAEARKGGKRDKMYSLSKETLACVERLRSFGHDHIFHWPYCEGYLWQKFSQVLKSAGLPSDRRSKFHRLRRTTASAATAAGLDASLILDHTDRRTTKAYLDPRIAVPYSAEELLASYLRGDLTPSLPRAGAG